MRLQDGRTVRKGHRATLHQAGVSTAVVITGWSASGKTIYYQRQGEHSFDHHVARWSRAAGRYKPTSFSKDYITTTAPQNTP